MDIEIQTELKPKYALVRCRFTFKIDAFLEVCERAFQFTASEGRKAVLVDIRDVTGEPFTTTERYRTGERVAELQRGTGKGIAMVVVGNEPMIDPMRFGETVGKNRGANGQVFTDIDEAVEWIEKVAADAGAR
jgi:hypothetical protein